MNFATEAWDDFGMPRYGFTYTAAGQETKEVVLGSDTKPDEKGAARARREAGGDRRGSGSAHFLVRLGGGHRPGWQAAPHGERHVLRGGAPFSKRSSAPAGGGRGGSGSSSRGRGARGRRCDENRGGAEADHHRDVESEARAGRRAIGGRADREVCEGCARAPGIPERRAGAGHGDAGEGGGFAEQGLDRSR